ncbi:MAG TPA: protoporphyrinogen oxidase [Vicinamibacteria bacterium]|nr:protoporphyrinogen oxidase [Vicinamibacteria bacterium]
MSAPVLDAAVVGGGLAGLAAAHDLHRGGGSFVLLEATGRWGGVVRTERVDGFLMEGGPDTLLAQKPEGLRLCRDLGLAERLVPTSPERRTVFVLHRGRLHPLPEGLVLGVPTRLFALARTSLFSWPGKLRMAADLVIPRGRSSGDESIASFFRRRLGDEALRRLGAPFLAGIHAGDAERLSLRATFPRLAEMEARHGSLIRALAAARAGAAPAPPFLSLEGGLSEIVDALVCRLPADRLRPHARVRALAREAGGYVVRVEGQEDVRARALVLAVPAPRAAALVAPLDAEAGALLAAIPFASTAVVCLGYRREDVGHALDGYGLIVPESEGLRTTACGFFSTKFPGRAPPGHVLLRAFLGGARDGGVLALADDELQQTVRREMGGVLGLVAPPVLSRVYRWPAATPQMEVGHFDRLAALERRLDGLPGLFLTGAGLRGTGIPDTVGDARRTAQRVLDAAGRNNVPSGTYRERDGRRGSPEL